MSLGVSVDAVIRNITLEACLTKKIGLKISNTYIADIYAWVFVKSLSITVLINNASGWNLSTLARAKMTILIFVLAAGNIKSVLPGTLYHLFYVMLSVMLSRDVTFNFIYIVVIIIYVVNYLFCCNMFMTWNVAILMFFKVIPSLAQLAYSTPTLALTLTLTLLFHTIRVRVRSRILEPWPRPKNVVFTQPCVIFSLWSILPTEIRWPLNE